MKALERDLPFGASARGERKDGSGLPDLHHIGMVVADLDRALAGMPKSLGLGPAHIIDGNMSTARVNSSGVVGFKLRIGFVWLGNLLLELLQPMDNRSPLAEYLKVHGEGMHHFGYLVRSIEHELDAMAAASDDGQRPALLAEAPSSDGHGISFCYIDGKNGHGAVIELIQRTPEAEHFWQSVYELTGGHLPA